MNATLYINHSPASVANKNLTKVSDVTVSFKGDANVSSPSLTLQAEGIDVSKVNYMWIEDFNRYYNVEITVSQQHIYAECQCDLLSSFLTYLLQKDAIIERQQNNYNLYLQDQDFRTYQFDNVAFKNFPATPFTKNLEYILLTL